MTRDKQIDRLRSEVERIVAESGTAHHFDAASWLQDWLMQEIPALGGRTPDSILAEPNGLESVLAHLQRMQSGAYS